MTTISKPRHTAASTAPSGEPWQWSATQIADAVHTGRISATEAMSSCLGRIRDTNPRLNALVDIDEDAALAAARVADAALAGGKPVGALHGVPTAIKINTDQAGIATTNGIPSYRDDVPVRDAYVTAALRSAGAVFVGRSNAPAFSFRWFSESPAHGRTLNPWDPNLTPGGSSGGAASAVAAGMLPVAHGNDIGGSIRYPAYACGIVGIRPTVGRIPAGHGGRRHAPRATLSRVAMSTQGPFARNVADLRLTLDAMTSTVLTEPTSLPVAAVPARPVRRVAVVRDAGELTTDPVLDAAVTLAADWLADAGIEVTELPVPELTEAHRLWGRLLLPDMRAMRKTMIEVADEASVTAMDHMIEHWVTMWGGEPDACEYADAWATRNEILARLGGLFGEYDVVLTPPSARTPFAQGTDLAGGAATTEMFDAQWPMTALPTLGLPGVTVPVSSTQSVPAGVQLIGNRFSDETLLDLAQVLEDRAGTFTPVLAGR